MADPTLSGTPECPACRLGSYQPGFSIPDAGCLCIGNYVIVGTLKCTDITDTSSCIKTYTVTPGNVATCNCNGKSYRITTFRGPTSVTPCKEATVTKGSMITCVCKKK